MLKDEIEQKFVRHLLAVGVTHADLEAIVSSTNPKNFAERLKSYITLFAREASASRRPTAA